MPELVREMSEIRPKRLNARANAAPDVRNTGMGQKKISCYVTILRTGFEGRTNAAQLRVVLIVVA